MATLPSAAASRGSIGAADHRYSARRRRAAMPVFAIMAALVPPHLANWSDAMNDQTAAPRSGGPVDPAVIDDLVAGNRILADQGVLDGYGHVSIRHPRRPDRYSLSRSRRRRSSPPRTSWNSTSIPIRSISSGRLMYIERYIHGEIYKARPDVNAIVHSHSPTVIPFSVTTVKLRPICHMSAFLKETCPISISATATA